MRPREEVYVHSHTANTVRAKVRPRAANSKFSALSMCPSHLGSKPGRHPHKYQYSWLLRGWYWCLLRGKYASVHACIPAQSCLTLCDPARLFYPWDSPGKNTRVGCHFLLQGSCQPRDQTHVSCVFCTGRWVLYQLIHQGSPKYASNESKLKSWWSIILHMPGWQKLK